MADAAMLDLVDGVRVVVPDSLDLITPYVLREQLDFFEDELRFVRRLLQPGQKVVDIGANYGVYTLPMAKKVGPSGHVWAFEPTSSTAGYLAQGIAANGFGQVTLEKKAVSSISGTAQLILESHSEANSISHDESPAAASEMVSLVTLDECMDRYRWVDIELIKIDAEGEECNIVKGGRRLLAELSPLVQYELRKGAGNVNLQLIQDFVALGYDSYRLVPGLNVLVPLQADAVREPYLLNLFCCKAGRADALAAQGLLLRSSDLSGAAIPPEPRPPGSDRHHWRRALALPYAAPFASRWEEAEAERRRSCSSAVAVFAQPRFRGAAGKSLLRPRGEFLDSQNVVRARAHAVEACKFGAHGRRPGRACHVCQCPQIAAGADPHRWGGHKRTVLGTAGAI